MGNADQFKAMSKGLDLAQAIVEADRCLLCHDAPCSEACPADTQPAEFIRNGVDLFLTESITNSFSTPSIPTRYSGSFSKLSNVIRVASK